MNKAISSSSLGNGDHCGWMTKQGGSYKSWKRRWFILKGDKLYYYKSKKDSEITGVVELSKESQVRKEAKKRSKHCFAIIATPRTFYMFPDKAEETDQWLDALMKAINRLKSSNTPSSPRPAIVEVKDPEKKPEKKPEPTPHKNYEDDDEALTGIRLNLQNAKELIPFITEASEGAEEGKIFEFWAIWADSIPPHSEVTEGAITFQVAVSADMDKISWRCCGPQNIFIQRMVDFFWNVGAPETEIDRLNDVGSVMNPLAIGSWIDMSSSNGMDGGWFFPVDIPMHQIVEASDPGDAIDSLEAWLKENSIEKAFYIGRDMGAAPPRQTEVKFYLPGASYKEQLECGLSAYSALGVPEVPKEALSMVGNCSGRLSMSVVTSSEGIVRLGILFPKPTPETCKSLSCFCSVPSTSELLAFEAALKSKGPAWVEFQFLMKGFGYGVYKEGFDVIFHYSAGEETPQ